MRKLSPYQTEKNAVTVSLLGYTSKPDEVGKGYTVRVGDDLAKEEAQSSSDVNASLDTETSVDKVPVVTSFSVSANEALTARTDCSLVVINEDAVKDDAPNDENSISSLEEEEGLEQETSFGGADLVVVNGDAVEDDGPKSKNSTSLVEEGEPEQEKPCGGADLKQGTPDPAETVKEQNKEPTSKVVEAQLETIAEDATSQPRTPPRSDVPLHDFETSHLQDFDGGTMGQALSGHHAVSRESLLGMLSEEVQQSLFTNGLSVGAATSENST